MTSERVVESTTHEDEPLPVVIVECASCGHVIPICPLYPEGRCKCGAHDWSQVR